MFTDGSSQELEISSGSFLFCTQELLHGLTLLEKLSFLNLFMIVVVTTLTG